MRSVKEDTLRARARKLGYAIHKSRSRSIHEDNLGRYALVKEIAIALYLASALMHRLRRLLNTWIETLRVDLQF